jgi:hypothetical protein
MPEPTRCAALSLYGYDRSCSAVAQLLGTTAQSILRWVCSHVDRHRVEPSPGVAVMIELRTNAKISDAVCWNEQSEMPSVWRNQMHNLLLRLSLMKCGASCSAKTTRSGSGNPRPDGLEGGDCNTDLPAAVQAPRALERSSVSKSRSLCTTDFLPSLTRGDSLGQATFRNSGTPSPTSRFELAERFSRRSRVHILVTARGAAYVGALQAAPGVPSSRRSVSVYWPPESW